MEAKNGKIYVVATPIGNLDDITIRATRVLSEVDWIAAEDTRWTRKLLNHLGIKKKTVVSYFDQVEEKKAVDFCLQIKERGETIALVSDAGTPCIADPGFKLVREAHTQGIQVSPIPGASAMTALVSAAGLPCHNIVFSGFLPTRSQALTAAIESWACLPGSIVFYEAARRLPKSLDLIARQYPDAQIAVGRELTKIYEEIKVTSIQECLMWYKSYGVLKGEVVAMVHVGSNGPVLVDEEALRKQISSELELGHSLKDLLLKHKDKGKAKKDLYSLILDVKNSRKL